MVWQRVVRVLGVGALGVVLAACGGTAGPTATLQGAIVPTRATATPTVTPTPSDTATPTASSTATATPSPSDTATPTASDTATATPSPSDTVTPTASDTATATPSRTATPTATPSATPTATATASLTRTASPSPTASASPTARATAIRRQTQTPTPPTMMATTRPASATPQATTSPTLRAQRDVSTSRPPDVAAPLAAAYPATPQQGLRLNQPVIGRLSQTQYAHLYTITTEGRAVVRVQMTTNSGTLVPALALIGPDGVPMARTSATDGRTAEFAGVLLAQPGPYTLVAMREDAYHGSTVGTYRLEVSRATRVVVPAALVYDQAVGNVFGNINNNFVAQDVVFLGVAGQAVSVETTTVLGNLDTTLVLRDGVGNVLAYNDDINRQIGQYRSRVRLVLPETGYYVVTVSRFLGEAGNTTGRFMLNVLVDDVGLTRVREAYRTPRGSFTLMDQQLGLLNDLLLVGDYHDEDIAQEVVVQAVITYGLPLTPTGATIGRAVLELGSCTASGLGLDVVAPLQIYADTGVTLESPLTPSRAALLVGTTRGCNSVDVSSVVVGAYASGERTVTFRVLGGAQLGNEQSDSVEILYPRLLITLEG